MLAILAFALAARVMTIMYGTNVDEGVYWVEGRELYHGSVIYRDTQFNKTPLVAMVAAMFFPLGEAPIYPMRAAMLAVSVFAIYGVYRLGLSLFDRQTALFAALLLAAEPFSAIWAKYLHTSTWAPWFEIAIVYFLIEGVRRSCARRMVISGIILGFYALSKQTAIFMLPLGVAAWLLFVPAMTLKRFTSDAGWWALGTSIVFLPFLATMAAFNALDEMWFDIFAAHKIMAQSKFHDYLFRWHEWKSIIILSPSLWLLPLGSLTLFRSTKWREIVFLWAWFAIVFVGNTLVTTHVWRHYFLVLMPPMALLAAYTFDRLIEWSAGFKKTNPELIRRIACAALIVAALWGWPKNDWSYPGLTLREERLLARHTERYCPEPYLLNLTNPSMYVWTGKEIPPAFRGEREVKIPFFMTIAGRGYLDRDDMQRTVDRWREMPIGAVAVFDKFLRQIMDDPVMEPLNQWLQDSFEPPVRVAQGNTYYGHFFVFERKR